MQQKLLATYRVSFSPVGVSLAGRSPVVRSLIGRIALGAASLALLLAPAQRALASVAVATRTTVTSAIPASGHGAELEATVATATGSTVAGGTVDFLLAGGQSLGSAVVAADGTASLLLRSLPPATATALTGSHTLAITAQYHAPAPGSPDAPAYADSRSVTTAVVTPEAGSGTPNFTVTGNPTTVTVAAGGYGTSVLTVTSTNSYAGAIEFSCSGLPTQVTCAFNPTQQSLTANGSFASTLQITTQASSGIQARLWRRQGTVALALVFPGALLLLGFGGRRRRLRSMQVLGVALLLAGGGLGLSGCSQRYGYLHHPPLTATGTPAGTYTLTVAVDGSQGASAIENDIPISLVVTN